VRFCHGTRSPKALEWPAAGSAVLSLAAVAPGASSGRASKGRADRQRPAARGSVWRNALLVDLGIFAFAFLVRAVYLWQLGHSPIFPVLVGDAQSYDAWAQRIASGDWLGRSEGVFYQAPLYPYFLAVVYTVAGHSLWAVRIVQACIGSASCVLLARAGRSFLSPAVGTAAGLVLALYAPAVFFDGVLQKSVLDVFLVCMLLVLLAGARADADSAPKAWRWLAAGATLGLLMLTRENAAVLVVAVLVWLFVEWRRRERHAWARAAAILAAGMAVVLLPVAVRNSAIGGEFHLTTSQFGSNFYIGNNAAATGLYVPLRPARGNAQFERTDATELAEKATGRTLTPGEVSDFWLAEALTFIRENPGRWLALMGRKLLLVFNATEVGDTEDLYGTSDYCWLLRILRPVFNFGVLFPLAVLGVGMTWERRARVWLLYLFSAAYAGSIELFYVFARYRYPLVPPLVLLACAGGVSGWAALRKRAVRPVVVWGGAALVAAAVAALPLVPKAGLRALTEIGIGNDLAHCLHQPEPAVEHFARALELEPRSVEACVGLADALSAQGKNGEALEYYRRAVAMAPGFEAAEYNFGLALADAGRPEEAMAHFARALEINPKRSETHDRIGTCLFALGRVDAAAEQYRQAIELDPSNAAAQNNWGAAMARLGDLSAAATHFRAALALEPAYVEAHRNLGKALLAEGRPWEALVELREALRLRPDDAETQRWLAQAEGKPGHRP
jgi:tetratricopeptide (TPR) repeat protein